MSQKRQTYTVSEAAEMTGYHPESIRRHIRKNKLDAAQNGRGNYRIARTEIARWWREELEGGELFDSIEIEEDSEWKEYKEGIDYGGLSEAEQDGHKIAWIFGRYSSLEVNFEERKPGEEGEVQATIEMEGKLMRHYMDIGFLIGRHTDFDPVFDTDEEGRAIIIL